MGEGEQPTAYSTSASKDGPSDPEQPSVIHRETHREPSKWKISKTGDGDVAMALFSDPNEIHEPIDPEDEKKLIRKIDFMILPYLAVCYAFFYIDKVLSLFSSSSLLRRLCFFWLFPENERRLWVMPLYSVSRRIWSYTERSIAG